MQNGYIINTSQPFRGNCQTVIQNGKIAYWPELTFDEYNTMKGGVMKVISDEEFTEMYNAYMDGLQGEYREITKQQYWDSLECLPPMRWIRDGSFEMFFVSECYTGTLYSHLVKKGSRYFSALRSATISNEDLRKRFNEWFKTKND